MATTFALFPVLSLGYAHAQFRSFYRLSTFEGSHMRKNTSLCMYNFNIAFWSRGAWECKQ